MYPPHVWSQIKGITAQKLIKALEKDTWTLEKKKGRQGKKGASTLAYRHPNGNRVVIHFHPKKTMSPRLLKQLLDQIGWSEEDLIRLRLVKRRIKKA